MANFYGHFTTGVIFGAAYGAAGAWYGHFDWGVVFLAGGLTAIGALMPDLDSDNAVPLRELFSLVGAIFPLFLIPRLRRSGLSLEQALVILFGGYLLIRYGLLAVFKKFTVHRGMFHSIPALLIAGLAVYNIYHHEDWRLRAFMAGGMMLGFLSHLVLDEIFAVDLAGVPRLKSSFGTALKFTSPSWSATGVCYALLLLLAGAAWMEKRDDDPFRMEIRPGRLTEGLLKKRW
ncbi:MAG: metal-dependent hydrolase [Gemmataceae bacterium]|nr:metal-dependent hydrolase [Gemmataceae bacterium]